MTRLVELEPTELARFLSDFWTQRNWQTNTQPCSEGGCLMQGQRGDGTKGLMLVLPIVEMTVETEHIKDFIAHAKKRGVNTIVIATQDKFADAVRGLATNHDMTLLDRDELGGTVADGGLEQTVEQYIDGDVFEVTEIKSDLPSDLPGPVEDALASLPVTAVRERPAGLIDGRGDAGGGDDDSGGSSGDGDGGDSSAGSLRDRLSSSVGDLGSGSPPDVRVVVVAALLLVLMFDSVAVLGPMLDGLGGSSGGGSRGDHGVSVSALSNADTDSADVVARWNARTTDTLRAGNQTYAPPKGERFVVVGFNATTTGDSPESLSQSAFVFKSDGIRYGHQSLSSVTGFDNDGLFAPDGDAHVWTVFTMPTNTTAGTVFVQPTNENTVAFIHDNAVSTDSNDND